MKKVFFIFSMLTILIINACDSSVETEIAKPTATVSSTVTYISTPNITPLPTIPTFTPTFDVSTIVTVTPAEKAECPKTDYSISFDNGFEKIDSCMQLAIVSNQDPFACLNKNLQNEVLDYLNSGGDINKIISILDNYNYGTNYLYVYKDLTGDKEPEFLLRDTFRFSSSGGYFIYTCVNENYRIISEASQEKGLFIYSIQDINLNGIPEVVFKIQNVLAVLEWDGSSFVETLSIRDFGESQYQIYDTNNDELDEIVLSRGYPPFWGESDEMPWRRYTSTYSWNGYNYTLSSKEFEYPQYRFQAIQDADTFIEYKMNEKAITYYKDAIFNMDLEWWSPERSDYLNSYLHLPKPTQSPEDPIQNPAEYPSLSSYAYYRIMLIQLAQGQTEEANQTYQTLLDTFGSDIYAKPYIEMATTFLDAYNINQKMYDGCAAAIQYAVEHPEILIPLGSDYHGWQSHNYQPADVCPFR